MVSRQCTLTFSFHFWLTFGINLVRQNWLEIWLTALSCHEWGSNASAELNQFILRALGHIDENLETNIDNDIDTALNKCIESYLDTHTGNNIDYSIDKNIDKNQVEQLDTNIDKGIDKNPLAESLQQSYPQITNRHLQNIN